MGRDAAVEHLRAACERFPHHFRLMQLLMDWLQEDGPEAVEPVIRKMIDLHPNDAWARRQLALNLAEQNRLDEAFASLADAEPLEPASIGYHGVYGALLKQAGRFEEAKENFRAVAFPPTPPAMNEPTHSAARTAPELAFMERLKQVTRQRLAGVSRLARELSNPSFAIPKRAPGPTCARGPPSSSPALHGAISTSAPAQALERFPARAESLLAEVPKPLSRRGHECSTRTASSLLSPLQKLSELYGRAR